MSPALLAREPKAPSQEVCTMAFKGSAHISKARYNQFESELGTVVPQEYIGLILEKLCQVLRFDPNASSYNRDRVASRMQETGQSSYQLYQKKHYDENKKEMDENNLMRYKKRVAKGHTDPLIST